MNYKSYLDKHPIFNIVSESAEKLGVEVFVIGGYVRDLQLKKDSKDIDFVCVGDGIILAKAIAKSLGKEVPVVVYKKFGTALVKYHDLEMEFVGARKESYQSESRKPNVEAGTLQQDLDRRDFTINALGISLNKANYGNLIDPFGGIEAIEKKVIETPLDPAITFSDDPLRIMRAVRFASQLNFDIAPETFEAITNNAERLKIVSQERITEELNMIILSPLPSYGFKLLYQAGILRLIFPEMADLQGVEVIQEKGHKDNFYHTLKVLDNLSKTSSDLWLRWAAILHDIAKPLTKKFDEKTGWTFHGHEDKGAKMVPEIFRRLRLPLNDKMRKVKSLVRLHLRPIALVKEEITDAAIRRLLFEAGEDLEDLLLLCRADITSKNHQKVKKFLSNFDKVEKKMRRVEEKDKIRNFQPVISGNEIMSTFNLSPSKVIGEIKDQIKEAILDGKIKNTHREVYNFMIRVAAERGLTPAKKYSQV
ncbi:MAG: HD domain-containing protein [Bacteroidetes bacterium]|nr:HD domain-containing protein [Bacteroidota bacterium]